ncbi:MULTISPECIES: MarR family transcriptional regulator [unclassified Rhizobium]|uniref:MarR family winged helix-turn-helix transcriptional regulator n=1 Tax=unclassified Rhizobium TaxID=2613769 RepID=UPI000EA89B54|nr:MULTISPECIES: MarR family transcriptional regulator [unclassified Rhizobium]AYG64919.1 MarR family transcriptional regulator [Rhizobium sp. CCGE531]AYG71403.1 MarR family transcriptional regulator [Rhizobium sp. CCGE532]
MMADKEILRLENLFGAMSLALVDKMEKAFADETGHGPSAIAAIVQIGTEPGITIETLRRMIALSHSATVRLVDQLVASDLVLRAGGVEGDKRARSLQLTESGRALFGRSLAARRAVIDRAFKALKPEETEQLGRLIEKLLPALVDLGDDQDVVCRVCDQGVCDQDRCPIAFMS